MSMFLAAVSSSLHVHIYVVIIISCYLWIKFNMKMPKFLTVGTVNFFSSNAQHNTFKNITQKQRRWFWTISSATTEIL